MELKIGNKTYKIEFNIEASLNRECVDTITEFLCGVDRESKNPIQAVLDSVKDKPKTVLAMLYAGLLENHGVEGDGTVMSMSDAKKLLKQYFAEHKDDEKGNYYDLYALLLGQMEEDGFFGLIVLVPFIRNNFGGDGQSMLTASVLLAIIILPSLISVSESALRAVPENYYEGALALGASHERSVFFTVVPAAKSGILAAVILGIGRAVGETMAVMMVAGNVPNMPDSLFQSVRFLTTAVSSEMAYSSGLQRQALFSIALVLFLFIMLINATLNFFLKREKE